MFTKDQNLLLGGTLFVLIVLTAMATAIKPRATVTDLDYPELKTEIISQGIGDRVVKNGDKVKVHYTGTLKDGTEFDSSIGSDPYEFTVGKAEVIEGWDQGILGMKQGEKRYLYIPASMGYGSEGSGSIPANAGLKFEVELTAFSN